MNDKRTTEPGYSDPETLLIYLRGCVSRADDEGMINVPADYITSSISALTELQHRREAEAGGWSRSEAPLERFVLVRPIGLHHSGEPFTPTVAQCLDWSGTRRWYTPMNEIEPIEFGESIEQDGLPDNLRFHGTEWRYLPDDPALAASPSSPASGVRVTEAMLDNALIAQHENDPAWKKRYDATAIRLRTEDMTRALIAAIGEHP